MYIPLHRRSIVKKNIYSIRRQKIFIKSDFLSLKIKKYFTLHKLGRSLMPRTKITPTHRRRFFILLPEIIAINAFED